MKKLYIHIPKTGGHSVKEVCDGISVGSYHPMYRYLSEEKRNADVFVTVRNPWAWYVSFYTAFTTGHRASQCLLDMVKGKTFKEWLMMVMTRRSPEPTSFFNWTKMCRDNIGACTWITLRACITDDKARKTMKSISDVDDKRLGPKFYIPIENHEALAAFLGVPGIPQRNSSNHTPYMDYYDDGMRDLVMEKDRIIIGMFGYSFGGDDSIVPPLVKTGYQCRDRREFVELMRKHRAVCSV
jgi:hypothetical protein